MHISKHLLIGLIGVVVMGGNVGLLSPLASQAQFGPLAPLERLTESGCVATPVWDEIIEGRSRWIAKMDGAAYCDRQTGVLWEAVPGGEFFSWSEAKSYCWNLRVGENGQLGWTLPFVEELASLVDRNSNLCEAYRPCLPDGHPFKNVRPEIYWSKTAEGDNNAWSVDFFREEAVKLHRKTSPFHAWCVRHG